MKNEYAQQLPLEVPPARNRQPGHFIYEDRVVIIKAGKEDNVTILTGHITSTPCSHHGIDNKKRVIVWGDEPFNDLADNADDAHEQRFDITSHELFKREEAEVLKDPSKAIEWFNGIYNLQTARLIAERLQMTDLDVETFAELMFDAIEKTGQRITHEGLVAQGLLPASGLKPLPTFSQLR